MSLKRPLNIADYCKYSGSTVFEVPTSFILHSAV